jgi:hypothetical protein
MAFVLRLAALETMRLPMAESPQWQRPRFFANTLMAAVALLCVAKIVGSN